MERVLIISYVISMIFTAGFIYCVYREKYWVFEFVNRIKKPIQQIVYILLMLLSSYAYIGFSLFIKDNFNALICSVLLLFSIWAADVLFSISFKENSLKLGDKKLYIFMAYAGTGISGFIIAYQEQSKSFFVISSIAISVLIGAYVPFTLFLEDGKKGKVELRRMKEELKEKYKKILRECKTKRIFSTTRVFVIIYGILLELALSPAKNLINDIGSGIGMGMVTVTVVFVGALEVKKRLAKSKNKGDEANQEKTDEE